MTETSEKHWFILFLLRYPPLNKSDGRTDRIAKKHASLYRLLLLIGEKTEMLMTSALSMQLWSWVFIPRWNTIQYLHFKRAPLHLTYLCMYVLYLLLVCMLHCYSTYISIYIIALLHGVPESDVCMFVQGQTGAYFLCVCVHSCSVYDGTCINRSKWSGRFVNEGAERKAEGRFALLSMFGSLLVEDDTSEDGKDKCNEACACLSVSLRRKRMHAWWMVAHCLNTQTCD